MMLWQPNGLTQTGQSWRRPHGGVPDYFVDSVSGNDANSGLSEAAPKQTLTAGSALLANDKRIGLKAGSIFFTSIDQPSLTGVTVGSYGLGARPIINCADTLSGWTLDSGKALTYKIDAGVVLAGVGTVYVTLQEDDVLLQRVASSAAAEALAGSFYVTGDTGTVDFYVHPSDGGDPDSNGKVYTYAAREYAIRLGDGATVTGIEAKNNRHNDGSIVLGANSSLTGSIVRNGHKHNALVGHGSVVSGNSFLEGHKHDDSGIMLVVYSPGAITGLPDSYITDNLFTARGLRATPIECIFAHTSGANGGTNIHITDNQFVDCFGGLNCSASNIAGDVYFDENYVTFSAGFTTMPYAMVSPYLYGGKYFRFNRFWMPEPFAKTFTVGDKFIEAGKTIEFDDNNVNNGPYWNWCLGATGGSPDVTARRNKGSVVKNTFIHCRAADNIVRDVSANVMGCGEPVTTLNTTSIITCDGNNWLGVASFKLAGVDKTWAQWVALGYDTTSGFSGDNRSASLPLGASLAGTLADWPNIWLWINAQEAASITSSGGDVSAVADLSRPGRNLVLHEPTPASDRVTISTLGGKPWFTSVLDGGLKYVGQDYSAPLGFIAAVLRLDAILSSAVGQQYVIGTEPSSFQDRGMILGSVDGAFADEVFTFRQGGSSWHHYDDAGFSQPATTPFLVVAYYDPIAAVNKLRINGVALGSFTNTSAVVPWMVDGNKNSDLMVLRSGTQTNRLQGGLGELLLAGPASFDFITAAETEMMTRWGIV